MPGKVERIFVDEGSFVKKGSIIAKLSAQTLIMQEIEYKTLKKDFERVQRLFDKGSLPEQKYDQQTNGTPEIGHLAPQYRP